MLLLKFPFSVDFSLSKRTFFWLFSECVVCKNEIFIKLQGGT